MSKTLKEQTAHGIFWNLLDKFGQQAIGIIVWIILMRYFLSPSDYGLVALIYIVNALGYVIVDSGFSNALIRKKEVTQTELSSVFYFNITLSVLFYLLIFFAAPFIALLFQQPILTKLVRLMALVIPLTALSLIQITLLSKAINFKKLASINLMALLCSGLLSLFLAWKGWGVWVLVVQPLSVIFVKNIGLWCFSSWHPSLIYCSQSIKELWKYSSKLLASSAINIICKNIYTSLIGIYYPLKEAGFFFNANKYSEIAYQTIMPAINSTVYPAMANMEENSESLQNAFRKTNRVSAFVFFPVMLGLIATAEPLILTAVGTKWLPIVPYFKVICVGYIFMGFNSIYSTILYIKGKSSAIFNLNLGYNVMLVAGILITIKMGVLAMAMGWTIIGIIYTLVFTSYVRKLIQYSLVEQLKDIMPYFTLAFVMGAGVYALSFIISNPLLLVSVQVVSGAAFYLGTSYLLGSKVFREVMEIVKNKMLKTA